MRNTCPLFGTRHLAGEFLYFALGACDPPVVIGLTHGAVEVGYPTAFLRGGQLRHLPLENLDMAGPYADLARRPVILVDDGLTPMSWLVDAVERIHAAEPESLGVLAPWLPERFRRCLPVAVSVEVVTLSRVRRRDAPLYHPDELPDPRRTASYIREVADNEHADLFARLAAAGPA